LYGNLPYNEDVRHLTRSPQPAKTERLEARITTEQKELFQMAAAIEGRSVSDFVTYTALAAARRLVQDQTATVLSPEESRRFVETLLNPPKPNAKLRRAADRFRKLSSR
jgi:uncharacterized protein (DUF1778 family)